MGTIKQALDKFNQHGIHTEDNLKLITNLITQILEREQGEIQVKIEQEESHVKKVEERLKSLQNNTTNSGPANVVSTDGSTGDKLWKEFDLRRTAVVGELHPKSEKAETSGTSSISSEESNYLRYIADSALKFCCKEYEQQQKELGRALSYCPKENSISKDQIEVATTFQMELESDVTHYLFQKLLKDREGKFVIKDNKKIEQYLKACVDVCWYIQVHRKGAKFEWDIPKHATKQSFICVTTNCENSNSCERRVFRPALCLNGQVLNPGKYSCVSCAPGSNGPCKKENTGEMKGSTQRPSSASNVLIHLPSGMDNQGKSEGNMKEAKTESKGENHDKMKGSPRDEKSTSEPKKGQGQKNKGEDKKRKRENDGLNF